MATTDPGKYGIQNGFSEDAFGMTMEYFNGDYTRNNTGINGLPSGTQTSFTGTLMAQSWRSIKPQSIVNTYGISVNNPAMVTYEYDEKYQFNNNKYGTPNFTNNNFTEAANLNREHNLTYDLNGNIKTLSRNNASGALVSDFKYTYQPNTNKLAEVGNYASYGYDELGQMIAQDRSSGQDAFVEYNPNGAVIAIYSDQAHTQLRVSFAYDESGNRIKKTDHLQNLVTYYVSDVSGNTMAIYDNIGGLLNQKEIPIYATARIGVYYRSSNNYNYELTDHLGNVRVVINGTKLANGQADVISYSDYYPFGSPLTLQSGTAYRYGYQGQYSELDKETGWNNFDLRMYDAAICRWMSTDPYAQFYSPYVGVGNNPVSSVDPDWRVFKSRSRRTNISRERW